MKTRTLLRSLVVVERTRGGFSAYSPDLPGCIATGDTREEAEANMYEAVQMHVEGLREEGLPIPECESFAEYVLLKASGPKVRAPSAQPNGLG
jgi:predicted RNase H-like HicB family nuclease